LWCGRNWHVHEGSIFSKYGVSPTFVTMNLRIVLENTIKAHFWGFKFIPNPVHLRKCFINFFRWVGRSLLNIIKSPLKDFHEHINVFPKTLGDCSLITGWPIFYTKGHNNPHKNTLIYYKNNFVLIFQCSKSNGN
jgi:hypothetical protein